MSDSWQTVIPLHRQIVTMCDCLTLCSPQINLQRCPETGQLPVDTLYPAFPSSPHAQRQMQAMADARLSAQMQIIYVSC